MQMDKLKEAIPTSCIFDWLYMIHGNIANRMKGKQTAVYDIAAYIISFIERINVNQ